MTVFYIPTFFPNSNFISVHYSTGKKKKGGRVVFQHIFKVNHSEVIFQLSSYSLKEKSLNKKAWSNTNLLLGNACNMPLFVNENLFINQSYPFGDAS